MKLFISILFFLTSSAVFANTQKFRHGPTEEQIADMALHNSSMAQQERLLSHLRGTGDNILPFAEYQTTGYVVFSDDNFYGDIAKPMKEAIAKNLPDSVTLLIYTQSSNKQYQAQLMSDYSKLLPANRVKILQIPNSGSNDFWSRDNLPLPVWNQGQMALVNARYYYNFEPDSFFQNLFGVGMTSHPYFYEGGNFMANARGDCLVVNRKRQYPGGVSDTAAIPDDIFKNMYGCKTLNRFKHLKGIGHADEVMKFVSDDTVVTDTQEYVAQLEKAGFKVLLLPEAQVAYETYINSLIVNDTVFVPVFGESNDQAVMDAYKKLGFKVVPIRTDELATEGQGGVHCITMNYPPSTLVGLTRSLGAKIVQ